MRHEAPQGSFLFEVLYSLTSEWSCSAWRKKKKKEEKHSKFEKLKKDDITEKNYNQQLQYIWQWLIFLKNELSENKSS